MNDNTQKPRGYARVEFIKNIEEIKKMLIDGHSISSVYHSLFDAGKITMPYRTFYSIVRPDVIIRHREKKRQRKE
ncbi:TraK family protein [Desulfobulbus sp.]|uniref:TraK family protein n=1 Tax=Desulfobulbus sp. TaxID=895 RepID=UPI0038F77EAA